MAILGRSGSASVAIVLVALVGCRDETGDGTGGGTSSSSSGDGGASTTTATTTTATTTTGSTTTGAGGGPECTTPSDCGADSDCETFTCIGGACDSVFPGLGVPTTTDTPEDCQKDVCDGSGSTTTEDDNTDEEDDLNECTTDSCISGVPDHDPVTEGTGCTGPNNEAYFCNDMATCVECLVNSDCTSNVCTTQFTCAGAGCNDNVENGNETDEDCGGVDCLECETGLGCMIDADCLSGDCTSFVCQPTCFDGEMNQNETAIDCGGPCGGCDVGVACVVAADCLSGDCTSSTCGEYQLLVSELRPRGPNGAGDDFIEIYNPRNVAVTLTSEFEVLHRASGTLGYTSRFKGSGEVMPAHKHFLIAGNTYSGAAAGDVQASSGGVVGDKASVIIRRNTTILDAMCFHNGADPFTGDATYFCEGTPFLYVGGTSIVDRSFERLPGAAAGNAQDTGVSIADFQEVAPERAQNLTSAATP